MEIRRSRLIERLAKDEPAFGGTFHSGDITGARKAGDSTFDYYMVDLEHEGFDLPRFGDTLQWMMSRRRMSKSGSIFDAPTPVVRLPHHASEMTTWIASTVLDYGAFGIILPYTETAGEVEHMVNAMRYPRREPSGRLIGERRVWPKAALRYWGCENYDEYFKYADLWPLVPHGELVLLAMVATEKALKNIDEIATVPGLSGILFGAKHAWSAMGLTGKIDLDHPQLVDFRNRVLAAAKRNGLVAGTSVSAVGFTGTGGVVDNSFMQRRIDEGFRFFLTQGSGRPDLAKAK